MKTNDDSNIIVDALKHAGIYYKISNNEINLRCPVCGDSIKSQYHAHLYISLDAPYSYFCQRCTFHGSYLTVEILEMLNAASCDVSTYIRTIEKTERKNRRKYRNLKSFNISDTQHIIPLPKTDEDYFGLIYLKNRIGGELLSNNEILRYKIITCGLYNFLEANHINELTVHIREADRLHENCIGFLSADEKYIIFRNMDLKHKIRYTNYKLYPDQEGKKSFLCRSDIDLLALTHYVVCSEGIIDLIQIERTFYPDTRWASNFIGTATNGSFHETIFKQLLSLGILSQDIHLYLDNLKDGSLDLTMVENLKKIKLKHPFFQTNDFSFSFYRNGFPNEKDFGIMSNRIQRLQLTIR
jgi:hypothetical protein